MTPALEQSLRAEANALRSRGVLTWDAKLRAAGLDPLAWSGSTGRRDAATGAPVAHRSAELMSTSFDAGANTIDLVWSTGATVQRFDWDGPFLEVLDMAQSAVRLDRLNAGAPFLNTHAAGDLGDIIGRVVPGSAKIAGRKGICRVKLTVDPIKAGVVADIRSGIIANVSVGYILHQVLRTEASGEAQATCRVVDWEPFEISAVPVPADIGARIT